MTVWNDVEKVYQLLEQRKVYYALSKYVADKDQVYVVKFPDFGKLRVMHPDKFPEFQAAMSGYSLIDFKTVDLLPMRKPLDGYTENESNRNTR